MSEKAIEMEEEEIAEVETQSQRETKPKKEKKPKKERKPRKKRETKLDAKGFFGAIWVGILFVLKILWKILKFFLKYVLFPFWYTGVLFVKTFKFLRVRNKDPLTEEDKKYLSLIPTLFFMLAICIIIVYLVFYLDSVYNFLEQTKNIINDYGFWASIGQGIADFFVGLYWAVLYPIGYFIKYTLFGNFQELLGGHQWLGTLLLLVILVVGTGLLILLINFARKGKIFKVIKNFFIKIKNGIVKGHDAIRRFVLKYIVGERYVDSRPKSFFWTNVLLQMLVTLIFFVFAIYLVVEYYLIRGQSSDPLVLDTAWDFIDIWRFGALFSAILFAGVGVFTTWFFHLVHGVSTSPPKQK